MAASHDNDCCVIPLAGQDGQDLENQTEALGKQLEANPAAPLGILANQLQDMDPEGPFRCIVVARTAPEAIAMLRRQAEIPRHIYSNKNVPERHVHVVFMFPGQGSQYVQMGRGLYSGQRVFRAAFDDCAQIIDSCSGINLHEILYPDGHEEGAEERLMQTSIAQPALFSIEYALVRLLQSLGIQPDSMIGHSIGEYTAACISGVFSLRDALEVVCKRGSLMQRQPRGSMATFSAAEAELRPYLHDHLAVAAVNAPNSCVVSGDQEDMERLRDQAAMAGISSHPLRTSHAFHSISMEPVKEALSADIGTRSLKPPGIPFISNLTGQWFSSLDALDGSYWGKHLRNTVRFSEGAALLAANTDNVFIEAGPGNSLCTLIRQHMQKPSVNRTIATLRHPKEEHSDDLLLKTAFGKCWLAGVEVDWKSLRRQ